MSSSDPSSARRVTSQVVIIVGDLPKSREAGQLVELWRGETTHTGHTSDLPKLVPLLVDATFRHFGESTSGTVQHTFGEEEIKKLKQDGISAAELEKVKNKTESAMAFEDMSVMNRAQSIAMYELLGDANLMNSEMDKYLEVTAEDVRKYSNDIFLDTKSSTIYYRSKN